jgi:lipoprotein NlpD
MLPIDLLRSRLFRPAAALATLLAIVGCTNTPHRAPVEDRSPVPRVASTPAASTGAAVPALEPLKDPAVDSAARAGNYIVKAGDTLIRIGLDTGQNWKDLMRWNGLSNPNLIEVGQVLRVVPPGTDPGSAVARPVVTARVETRPLDARPAPAAAASAPASMGAPSAPAPPAVSAPVLPPPVATAPTAPRDADDDVSWGWPAGAPVAAPFDDARNKGLVFRGKAGDPVLAAADGRVVYAGSGLRGYGNLVILKHNTTYLTAYAHNQTLLVKDDQTVRKGQKIAEMGSTDAEAVQLHFEIRRQGKPVDPARLLPPR